MPRAVARTRRRMVSGAAAVTRTRRVVSAVAARARTVCGPSSAGALLHLQDARRLAARRRRVRCDGPLGAQDLVRARGGPLGGVVRDDVADRDHALHGVPLVLLRRGERREEKRSAREKNREASRMYISRHVCPVILVRELRSARKNCDASHIYHISYIHIATHMPASWHASGALRG